MIEPGPQSWRKLDGAERLPVGHDQGKVRHRARSFPLGPIGNRRLLAERGPAGFTGPANRATARGAVCAEQGSDARVGGVVVRKAPCAGLPAS